MRVSGRFQSKIKEFISSGYYSSLTNFLYVIFILIYLPIFISKGAECYSFAITFLSHRLYLSPLFRK